MQKSVVAKQTPFNRLVQPTERETLLMEYTQYRFSALSWRNRIKALAGNSMATNLESKWARQDAAECRKIWKEIQSL